MRALALSWLAGGAALVAGCFSGPDSPVVYYADLAVAPDLARPRDLSVSADLASPDLLGGDLAEPLAVSLIVTANPTMVVAATADVDAPDGSEVTVDYGPSLEQRGPRSPRPSLLV